MTARESTLALVSTAPNVARVAIVGRAPLGPDDVLIRTHYSGISTGTDKWVLTGVFEWIPLDFPLVSGNQRSGTVIAVGDAVRDFAIGQLVGATASTGLVGASPAWGGHAALVASVQDEVFDATDIDPLASAFLVSAQVGYNAASRIVAPPGAAVMVIGDGIIGSSAAMACRARGFRVLVIGRHERRLAPLAALGIETLDGRLGDLAAIEDFAPIAAIDTPQSDESFALYSTVLPERTGQIVFSGHSPAGTRHWADMELIQKREYTAHFVSGWRRDRLLAVLALMREGSFPLETLVELIAADEPSIGALADATIAGSVAPTAAAIDWRGLQP